MLELKSRKMKLAKQINGQLQVRNFKTIPELGIYAIGAAIDVEKLNSHGYYEVSHDPIYDDVLQHLGAYELIEKKAVRQVINRQFGTIEEEKEKKISGLKAHYNQLLEKTDWYFTRKSETGKEVPQTILDERGLLRSECDTKEAEINALTELREVLIYE